MNPIDSRLQRLVRAAACIPRELPTEAPFALECQVISAWRSRPVSDRSAILLPLFRGACLCACAIILISAALSLHALNETPPNEMVVLDSAIQLTLLQ
jgi:hypothetical protein